MAYWLMKSEPADVSVDDLAAMPKQTVAWYGVRNYQARNFMRDEMRAGDGVLFYHSSCPEPGIVGIAEVASNAYPDATQFDQKSKYFDAKSHAKSRAGCMSMSSSSRRRACCRSTRCVPRRVGGDARAARGNRLSITPVSRRVARRDEAR